MALMALDHFRNGFSNAFAINPTDLSQTSAALFMTRWITHFCAPVFVFLAGTGAFLAGARGRSQPQLAWWLLSRGLWLVVLEIVITGHLTYFNYDPRNVAAGVIWAIGWSMVALAGLVFLPMRVVALLGLLIVAGHNLFDGVSSTDLGAFGGFWTILHVEGKVGLPAGVTLSVHYPLIPWVGVMALGYGFGSLFERAPAARKKWFLRVGGIMMLAFIVLRSTNIYGDPSPWSAQGNGLFTLLSFLNCSKYPPSVLFLLMTLGPAVVLFPLWEKGLGRIGRFLVTLGRVPLFFYIIHLVLLHLSFWVHGFARYGGQLEEVFTKGLPPGYGYSLPVVYLIWLVVLVVLYPACHWFAGVKQHTHSKWLSYL